MQKNLRRIHAVSHFGLAPYQEILEICILGYVQMNTNQDKNFSYPLFRFLKVSI